MTVELAMALILDLFCCGLFLLALQAEKSFEFEIRDFLVAAVALLAAASFILYIVHAFYWLQSAGVLPAKEFFQ